MEQELNYHKQCLKLKDKLRNSKGWKLSRSKLLKAMKMPARVLNELVDTLEEADEIEVVRESTGRRVSTFYRLKLSRESRVKNVFRKKCPIPIPQAVGKPKASNLPSGGSNVMKPESEHLEVMAELIQRYAMGGIVISTSLTDQCVMVEQERQITKLKTEIARFKKTRTFLTQDEKRSNYDAGFKVGQDETEQARKDGYANGFKAGRHTVAEEVKEAEAKGFSDGRGEGYNDGLEASYDNAFNAGYASGKRDTEKAKAEIRTLYFNEGYACGKRNTEDEAKQTKDGLADILMMLHDTFVGTEENPEPKGLN